MATCTRWFHKTFSRREDAPVLNTLTCILWGWVQAKVTGYDQMTAGQAATVARNETEVDRCKEELEDLEETLNESIADAIRGRARQVGLNYDFVVEYQRCFCLLM